MLSLACCTAVLEARWRALAAGRALEHVVAHAAGVKGLMRPVLAAAAGVGVGTGEGRLADVSGEGRELVVVEVGDGSAGGDGRHRAGEPVLAHVDDLEPLEPVDNVERAGQIVVREAERVEVGVLGVARGDGAGQVVVRQRDILEGTGALGEVW